ncbi:MAG: tetratricopeptide repeat protein [Parvularculaceae bacterium]
MFNTVSKTKFIVPLIGAFVLTSCAATGKTKSGSVFSGKKKAEFSKSLDAFSSTGKVDTRDPIAQAAFWGTRYDREPENTKVAIAYSKSLRIIGSDEQSLRVIEKSVSRDEDNADALLEYGKALISNDRAFEAVRPIERAIAMTNSKDWRTYSAYGVALDKIGEHEEARKQYSHALKINPSAAQVQNNIGLSYALDGKLDLAERSLRRASSERYSSSRIRQNLALVLGFKGETREAERLARSDLPPQVADNNVNYFRSLLTQPAYWQDLNNDNVEMPSFPTSGASVPSKFEPTAIAPATPVPEPTRMTPAPKPTKKPEPAPKDGSILSQNNPSQPATFMQPASPSKPIQLETTSAPASTKKNKSGLKMGS